MRHQLRYQSGFTLIEVMVVVVIIGLLASIVAVRVIDRVKDAKVNQAKVQIRNLEGALQQFKLDYGRFPTTSQGLEALLHPPAKGTKVGYASRGSYLEKTEVPLDPWGHAYIYISPGQNGPDYDLKSLGADSLEGGEGYDADLVSWRL